MALSTFNRTCSKNVTGNLHLFLADANNVESVTVTAGEISDIVMTTDTYFHEIQADIDTLIRSQEAENEEAGIYNHRVEFKIAKANASVNEAINNILNSSFCGIMAIVMDSNQRAWIVGYSENDENDRPLHLESHNFDTEEQMNEIVLSSKDQALDLSCDSTINDYIINSIAAGTDLGFTP